MTFALKVENKVRVGAHCQDGQLNIDSVLKDLQKRKYRGVQQNVEHAD
jgi:hypothetical protein